MVRIAYRTSSGIYGPKDATFPKVVRDAEMQLKRCRLREHSLKRCISVLLVLAALCVCGLIVGLLATCEDEDDRKSTGPSDLELDDTPLTTQKSDSEVSETFYDEEIDTTGHTPSDAGGATLTIVESTSEILLESECTSCVRKDTALSYEIPESVSNETHESETSIEARTTEGIDPNRTDIANLSYSFYEESTSLLSHVQDGVLPYNPSHSEVEAPSPEQERMSLSIVQVQLPVQSKSELAVTTSTIADNPQVQPEAEREVPLVKAITVSSKSDPVVKVSFVTTNPADCG